MLSEVVTRNCVRNPGGHAESNPRPSEEGVSVYHVLRPLDRVSWTCGYLSAGDDDVMWLRLWAQVATVSEQLQLVCAPAVVHVRIGVRVNNLSVTRM